MPAQYLYVPGSHKGHKAYNPLSSLAVLRNTNKDWEFDFAKDKVEISAGTGINIHYGGEGDEIKNWSAGCQVPNRTLGSSDYQTIVGWCKTSFNYVLVPFDIVDRAAKDPDFRALIPGSRGSLVQKVKAVLGVAKGQIYDIGMVAAVVKYQKKEGLLADGIVGPMTLKAMKL